MRKLLGVVAAAVCSGVIAMGTVGCSSKGQTGAEVRQTGDIKLSLQTVAPSGLTYRLRNAVFTIQSVQTARTVATLFSDDDLFSNSLTAEVDEGEHIVTLQQGWFLERVTDGGIIDDPGVPSPGIPVDGPVFGTAGSTAAAGSFGTGGATSSGGSMGEAGGFDTGGTMSAGGSTAGGSTGFPGGEIVQARLLSPAIQFVFVQAGFDSFVNYSFRVGDDVIGFGPGRVNISIDVDDSGSVPSCDVDALLRRAVFETSLGALQTFTLREVLDQISANEGSATPGETLYHQVIDSYATADQANLPDAVHCGDETTNGEPSLNGFPITCNRQERFQFDNLDAWFPTAIVNRLDLAPESGAHCGQQRLMFANNVQGRMFFIIEAQIPNPSPDLGVAGCTPLAQFWANLQTIDDSVERGLLLREAFLFGAPELTIAGFDPFLKASHFSVGSGTLRTNNFDDFAWTLREFKLVAGDEALMAIPFPVGESPNGQLWNDSSPLPQGPGCREAFLEATDQLLSDNPAEMSFVVPQECRDAESRNDFSQDYAFELSQGDPGGFASELEARLAGTGLTASNIATRARFAGSCIGCHEEAIGTDLGRGVQAPFSNGFVHVDEFSTEQCGNDACFRVSPALRDVFLPMRFGVVEQLLGQELPRSCEPGQGGGEQDGGMGPVIDPAPQPGPIPLPLPTPGGPRPMAEPGVASSDLPVEELIQQDSAIRDTYGELTLGGQSAQRTH